MQPRQRYRNVPLVALSAAPFCSAARLDSAKAPRASFSSSIFFFFFRIRRLWLGVNKKSGAILIPSARRDFDEIKRFFVSHRCGEQRRIESGNTETTITHKCRYKYIYFIAAKVLLCVYIFYIAEYLSNY